MRLLLPHGPASRHESSPRTHKTTAWWSRFRLPSFTPSSGRGALLVGLLMAVTLCLGDRGLVRTVTLLRDRAAVRAELVRLETHRAELESELRRYSSDGPTIDRVARESLDWVKRGETVYKFPAK